MCSSDGLEIPSMPHDGLTLVLLSLASTAAGFCDAVVGGGGLIQFPALLILMPSTAPATLVGTNKLAGLIGTAAAIRNLARIHPPRASIVIPLVASGAVGSVIGAHFAAAISPNAMKTIVVLILAGVWAFTWRQKDLGKVEIAQGSRKHLFAGIAGGGLIGIYNGIIGPGVGTLLILLLVAAIGLSFLQASATAKVVDVTSDIAAMIAFAIGGHVLWKLGLVLAVCNVVGNLAGSRLALQRGSGFVRNAFLIVVAALILRLAFDLV